MDRPLGSVQLTDRKVPVDRGTPRDKKRGTHYQEPPRAIPKALAQFRVATLRAILWAIPVDSQDLIDTVQHSFAIEAMRRSIGRIEDVESLQVIAMKLIETNEASRKLAAALMLKNIELEQQIDVLGAQLMD